MNLCKRVIPKTAKDTFWLSFWLCVVVCLFIIFVIAPLTGISRTFGGHGHDGYLEIAGNIVRGSGFVFEPGGAPDLHRPPLYPLFLVPIILLPDFLQRPALILMQSLMVGCIGVLIFQIARHLFGLSTARTAIIIFLLNPWVYWNAKNPMTAIMQGFLYILFVFLIGRYTIDILKGSDTSRDKKRWRPRWLAIGVTGAALTLSHGAMLAVTAILLFTAFLIGIFHRNKHLIKTTITSGIVIVLLVAPWTYRNWLVFKRFVPVTSNYGVAYAHGLVHWNICGEDARRPNEGHEAAALRFLGIEGDLSRYMQFYGLKDPDIDAKFNEKMKEHIRTKPGVFLKKLLLNSIDYYFPSITYPFLAVKDFSAEKLAITIFHLILWGLTLTAIYRMRRQKNQFLHGILVLVVIVLYAVWYLPFVTFIGHSLYTFGTIPFVSILAARALAAKQPDMTLL